ncbi:MAG: S46 family peptidase, partial [Acidobacteria bacterium]|nr:S46 family peptidase [Acidobacteriota bacterium]
ITEAYKPIYPGLMIFENGPNQYGSILPIARQVYRYATERQKPNGERLREYAEAGLASLEESIFSSAPLTESLEAAVVAEYLRFAVQVLGAENPVLKAVLAGRSPEQVASEAIASTKLFSVEERKRLAASADLVQNSPDGLLRLIRLIEPEARRVRKEYEDRVQARQSLETARLAQAQYALGGNVYPDATFTLRVSFGPAIGYRAANGKSINWMTDFGGMYRHATGTDPFALPKRWLDRKKQLTLGVPFNFVTTADTHGGNSGSPTVNTKGEIIGILFDGNIEGLPNRYIYTEKQARSVHVASQGIIEALRKVYQAEFLLKELGF